MKEELLIPLTQSREEEGEHIFGVSLKQGYSKIRFCAIPMCTVIASFMGTFVNTSTLFLLKDPNFFNIPATEIGRVLNNIIFIGLLFQICLSLVIGYIFDIFGRKLTLGGTVLLASISLTFLPFAAPSIPLMIALRFCMSMAFCALNSQPLIIDYVVKEYRGRAIAISNMGIIIGDLITFVVILNITKQMNAYNKFLTFTLTLASFAVTLFMIIKEPYIEIKDTQKVKIIDKAQMITKQVWQLCKSDIIFPICLIGAMTQRTMQFLFSSFMMLWVSAQIVDPVLAQTVIQKVTIVTVISTCLVVIPAGKLSDKIPSKIMIPLSFLMSSISLMSFQLLQDPLQQEILMYFVVTMMFASGIFAMTAIETCFSRNLTKDIRGTMRGVETLFGSIGGLFFTKVGGYMFDIYGSKSPFILFSLTNLAFAILVSVAVCLGKVKH